MNKISQAIYKIKSKFLEIFGEIKVYKWPLFTIYDPSYPKMDGKHMLKALSVMKPGDVILRGYDHYADGFFIPGDYSHGAIYVGNNNIIHATSIGVNMVNAIDFMICDRICVLRPRKGTTAAVKTAKQFLKDEVPYDFGYTHGVNALYCFELAAECYKNLNIELKKASIMKGLISKKEPVYLASSFTTSPDF